MHSPDLHEHLQDLLERELRSRRRHRALPNDEREFAFLLVTDADLAGLPGPVAILAITGRNDSKEIRQRIERSIELCLELSMSSLLVVLVGPVSRFLPETRSVVGKYRGPIRLGVWGPDELGDLERRLAPQTAHAAPHGDSRRHAPGRSSGEQGANRCP